MYAFMILCSLGAAFYLVLLVALYRDGRRRRGQRRAQQLVGVLEPGRVPANSVRVITGPMPNWSDGVLWVPITKRRWGVTGSAGISGRVKVVGHSGPVAIHGMRCR
jgi:hypothetical protein